MRALRVTARLTEPFITYEDGMHLDGVLAYGAFMGLSPEERDALPRLEHTPWAVDFELPLARWACEQPGRYDYRLVDEHGRVWGWKASAACYVAEVRDLAQVRKRPPLDEMRRYAKDKSVLIAGGSHKAWDLPFPTVFAPQVAWFCAGDPTEIQALLERVPALGKRTNHGHGTVAEWRVEPWSEDWSTMKDGLLMRRVPAAMGPGSGGAPGRGAIRPPYHHRSRVCPSVDPLPETLRSPGVAP